MQIPEIDEMTIVRLRRAGLRPTRQRRELVYLLFAACREAVSAEALHLLAHRQGVKVSLATVYGTLHSLCDAGLVREIAIDARRYFDTTPDNHQYHYYQDARRLVAVPGGLDQPPDGYRIVCRDVIVRLERE